MLFFLICFLIIVLHFWARHKLKKEKLENEEASYSTASNISTYSTMPEILESEDVSRLVDDIITYKEVNGIVYGYLNQEALDLALYLRAKKRTHNFEDKNKWDDERGKRAVNLKDISTQKHVILFGPVSEGEYVSEGNFILDLGLDSSYTSYFIENKISEYETWLSCGVKVFSRYSGFLSYKVEYTKIGSISFQKPSKDGDLLFTIKLAAKPIETSLATKEVKFSHSMLPRDFIEDCSSVRGVSIKRWLVDSYTRVKEGEDILELSSSEKNCIATIKSPFSGIMIKKLKSYDKIVNKGYTMFIIYDDENKLKKEKYPNEIEVEKDNFTKAITIKGRKHAGNIIGFSLDDNIYLNFEYSSGNYFLIVKFERKDINLNKKCTLHLLLGDDSVITSNAITSPIKDGSYHVIKYGISQEDMAKLETINFVMYQITNEEGITIKKGYNDCCWDREDTTGTTHKLSFEVFKDFIKDFNKLVKENKLENDDDAKDVLKEKDKEPCYVYLMIDTTNNFHKIGISNHPRYREHTLQSDKPTIELLCAKKYPSRAMAESIESALHKTYANKRIRGEWFNLDASDIEDIKQLLS